MSVQTPGPSGHLPFPTVQATVEFDANGARYRIVWPAQAATDWMPLANLHLPFRSLAATAHANMLERRRRRDAPPDPRDGGASSQFRPTPVERAQAPAAPRSKGKASRGLPSTELTLEDLL